MAYDALAVARSRSEKTLAAMRRLLEPCADVADVLTVAVSGSLGRLEQTGRSDADVIVVLRDEAGDSRRVMQTVWRLIEPLGLPLPKSGGIFSVATTRRQLCDASTLGLIDENMAVFGQRMQLLLDSRAIFNAEAFRDLQAGILGRFTDSAVPAPTHHADIWRPLLDDLLRYHRSLCVRYQHAKRLRTAGWRELQLKAGYSRLINIAGLLFLLAESTVQTDRTLSWAINQLSLTPLQRIAHCYDAYPDDSRNGVFSHYGAFLAALDDELFRSHLDCTTARDLPAAVDSRLTELHAAAGELKSDLLRFLLARVQRGDWPQRFLEHLLL